eukprot:7269492-Alexandrium_andersonii.AAC.1
MVQQKWCNTRLRLPRPCFRQCWAESGACGHTRPLLAGSGVLGGIRRFLASPEGAEFHLKVPGSAS